MIGTVKIEDHQLVEVSFRVDGVPRPKGSWRTFKDRFGRQQWRNDSEHGPEWEHAVAQVAVLTMGAHAPIDDAVEVELAFRCERPKLHWTRIGGEVSARWRDYPDQVGHGRYDIDKLERLVLDAMSKHVYRDDTVVCDVIKRYRYAVPGVTLPGVDVVVRRLPPLEAEARRPRPRGGVVIRRRPGGQA